MPYTPVKPEWIAILPDHPGNVDKRLQHRPEHLERSKQMHAEGTKNFGGAFFDKHPVGDEKPSFKGSITVYEADTEEEVRKMVEQDPYAVNGVWDLSKVKTPSSMRLKEGMDG
ncbi:hypothetical protein YB2330_002625 [Saitoella coloradoensis]